LESLFEVVLLSLMVFILSRMLPGIEGSPSQVAIAILVIIGASTLVSQWLARATPSDGARSRSSSPS
jgi:hypothetical protein